MANESTIPGLVKGMFFEHYVFSPRSNFKEEDLVHIAKLIDIAFDHDNFPHKKHFVGRTFTPKEGLTVGEFVDILQSTNLVAPLEMLEKMPGDVAEQFNDDGQFEPFEDFTLEDMVQFLIHFVVLKISTEQFNGLPRHVQRQFMVHTRDGKKWRYGDRRPA